MPKTSESNIGIKDRCIDCGHYHFPADWLKKARECTVHSADAELCKCTAKKFVPRSHKRYA